jgi:hypothetical protein
VHRFYYNGFTVLWNAGLRDAFFAAKNAFPSYELWVTGMSLGGALTGFAAPYISQMGYFDKTNIKMISFGEPPVGHGDFADRYPDLVPYSYRVTHRNDIVPHIIPYAAGYRQHKNEVSRSIFKNIYNFRFGTTILWPKEHLISNVMKERVPIVVIV